MQVIGGSAQSKASVMSVRPLTIEQKTIREKRQEPGVRMKGKIDETRRIPTLLTGPKKGRHFWAIIALRHTGGQSWVRGQREAGRTLAQTAARRIPAPCASFADMSLAQLAAYKSLAKSIWAEAPQYGGLYGNMLVKIDASRGLSRWALFVLGGIMPVPVRRIDCPIPGV